jgi:hypothetical protein
MSLDEGRTTSGEGKETPDDGMPLSKDMEEAPRFCGAHSCKKQVMSDLPRTL